MYEQLVKEVDRRNEIEEKRAGKNRRNSKKIGFQGLDEEGKIDPKEKLKQEIDDAYSLLSKNTGRKEEIKKSPKSNLPLKPALKSALKKTKFNENYDGPNGPRPFESTIKTNTDDNGDHSDDDFNILFTRDDPKRNETKKLLLFQYKIKFMRGAKTLVEE